MSLAVSIPVISSSIQLIIRRSGTSVRSREGLWKVSVSRQLPLAGDAWYGQDEVRQIRQRRQPRVCVDLPCKDHMPHFTVLLYLAPASRPHDVRTYRYRDINTSPPLSSQASILHETSFPHHTQSSCRMASQSACSSNPFLNWNIYSQALSTFTFPVSVFIKPG